VNRVIDLRVPSNIRGISLINDRTTYVKSVHCHHGMARPRVAERGDGLQIWRVAANILYKQSRTADSG
jgi:nitrous oxidase accessory protein NosD